MRLIQSVLELLFPRKCVLCRNLLTAGETDLCHSCRADAPRYREDGRKIRYVSGLKAVWYYEGCVRESLLRYKFYNARSYADAYGRMVAMELLGTEADLLTWVPVSARRKRKRGYDQVELLAKAVSRELNIPCVRLLEKRRHNRAQSSITSAEERRANVLGVYRVVDPAKMEGKRIVLLDDIVTTGATASECARMLRTAGAKDVLCAAVAAGRNQK